MNSKSPSPYLRRRVPHRLLVLKLQTISLRFNGEKLKPILRQLFNHILIWPVQN